MDYVDVDLKPLRKSKHPVSRYRHLSRYWDRNNNHVIECYEKIDIRHKTGDDFHEVTSGEEHMIDLIAHNYYGNENLWWIIAEANKIINPFFIPAGTILRIPSYNNLIGYKGILA